MEDENKAIEENTEKITADVKDKATAHATKSDDKKPGENGKVAIFFTNLRSEFKKIVWPSRKDLTKQTITVIITSLFFGAIILGMDAVYAFFLNAFVKYFG